MGNLNGTKATKACRSCAIDGDTTIDENAQSGCATDGTAFMCTDQQPLVYNETLTLGFVAASFTGIRRICLSVRFMSFLAFLIGTAMYNTMFFLNNIIYKEAGKSGETKS